MTAGPGMAAIGLAMHFTVALTATVAFYALSRRIPALRTAPVWIVGPLSGVLVFCAMNYGTLPALSWLRGFYLQTPPRWPGPYELAAARHSHGVRRPADSVGRQASSGFASIRRRTAQESDCSKLGLMRKGFTRKPHDAPAEVSAVKNYITPGGLQRLKDELRFLLNRERPAVTKVVAWAASNGDRSENADYQYNKRRLREIDRRIRFLTKRIDAAEIVDPETPEERASGDAGVLRRDCALRHRRRRRTHRAHRRSRRDRSGPQPYQLDVAARARVDEVWTGRLGVPSRAREAPSSWRSSRCATSASRWNPSANQQARRPRRRARAEEVAGSNRQGGRSTQECRWARYPSGRAATAPRPRTAARAWRRRRSG